MICKGMSAKQADSCSDLTFADDVVAWARKDYAFKTTISIPVPSSSFFSCENATGVTAVTLFIWKRIIATAR